MPANLNRYELIKCVSRTGPVSRLIGSPSRSPLMIRHLPQSFQTHCLTNPASLRIWSRSFPSTVREMSALLLKSGASQLFAGFVWGTQIPNTPYPRIALSTHMGQIQEGLMTIAAGYLIQNMDLSPIQHDIVVGAHLGMWVFDFMGICNSFWGTKGLPMVSPFPSPSRYLLRGSSLWLWRLTVAGESSGSARRQAVAGQILSDYFYRVPCGINSCVGDYCV